MARASSWRSRPSRRRRTSRSSGSRGRRSCTDPMRGVVAVVLVAVLAPSARADHHGEHRDRHAKQAKQAKPPKPGTPLTRADLGWPETTTTVELADAAKVFVEPTSHSHRLGKIAKGTRLAFHSIVAGHSSCRTWFEL